MKQQPSLEPTFESIKTRVKKILDEYYEKKIKEDEMGGFCDFYTSEEVEKVLSAAGIDVSNLVIEAKHEIHGSGKGDAFGDPGTAEVGQEVKIYVKGEPTPFMDEFYHDPAGDYGY